MAGHTGKVVPSQAPLTVPFRQEKKLLRFNAGLSMRLSEWASIFAGK
jgi:hypothetical protein